jgi:hypothetical protein
MTDEARDCWLTKILTLLRDDKDVLLASVAIDVLWELQRVEQELAKESKARELLLARVESQAEQLQELKQKVRAHADHGESAT